MDPVAGIEDCSCLVGKGISTGAAEDRKPLRMGTNALGSLAAADRGIEPPPPYRGRRQVQPLVMPFTISTSVGD